MVTTANPDAALNFGYESQMGHDDRYELAREFVDVVTGLWAVLLMTPLGTRGIDCRCRKIVQFVDTD